MEIIPVLDLARGVAVHARAGDRQRYEAVRSVLAPAAGGDPVALLRAFRALGAAACYVADLDAIQGRMVQRAGLQRLAKAGTRPPGSLLVDAGVTRPAAALEILACGADQIVVGLESLHGFRDLAAIAEAAGRSRTIFSLDLRLGAPILHPALAGAGGTALDPLGLAAQAVAAGAETLLVLDLGRVGTGCGVDLDLLNALRRRFPAARLLAGGGVRSRGDLDRMRDAGCDGALVASAIHAGWIGAEDIVALAQSGTSDSR